MKNDPKNKKTLQSPEYESIEKGSNQVPKSQHKTSINLIKAKEETQLSNEDTAEIKQEDIEIQREKLPQLIKESSLQKKDKETDTFGLINVKNQDCQATEQQQIEKMEKETDTQGLTTSENSYCQTNDISYKNEMQNEVEKIKLEYYSEIQQFKSKIRGTLEKIREQFILVREGTPLLKEEIFTCLNDGMGNWITFFANNITEFVAELEKMKGQEVQQLKEKVLAIKDQFQAFKINIMDNLQQRQETIMEYVQGQFENQTELNSKQLIAQSKLFEVAKESLQEILSSQNEIQQTKRDSALSKKPNTKLQHLENAIIEGLTHVLDQEFIGDSELEVGQFKEKFSQIIQNAKRQYILSSIKSENKKFTQKVFKRYGGFGRKRIRTSKLKPKITKKVKKETIGIEQTQEE